MWILQLNPMREKAEYVKPVAIAKSKERLEQFLKEEEVDPYRDGVWHKVFEAGGPLEWYNAPDDNGEAWVGHPAIYELLSLEEYVQLRIDEFTEEYNRFIDPLLKV